MVRRVSAWLLRLGQVWSVLTRSGVIWRGWVGQSRRGLALSGVACYGKAD